MTKRHVARKNGNRDEYKKLRNECNRRICIEKKIEAGNMIQEDPNSIWKIYNTTVHGRKESKIKLKEDGVIIDDDKEVANIFNRFFKEKTIESEKA